MVTSSHVAAAAITTMISTCFQSTPARKNIKPPMMTMVSTALRSGCARMKPLVTPMMAPMGNKPNQMLLIMSRLEYSQNAR